MSDTGGPKAATNKDLLEQITELNEKVSYWHEMATANGKSGKEWKEHADGLAKELKEATSQERQARDAFASARAEAAELRGYIRRVNELDPPERRELRQEYSGDLDPLGLKRFEGRINPRNL